MILNTLGSSILQNMLTRKLIVTTEAGSNKQVINIDFMSSNF